MPLDSYWADGPPQKLAILGGTLNYKFQLPLCIYDSDFSQTTVTEEGRGRLLLVEPLKTVPFSFFGRGVGGGLSKKGKKIFIFIFFIFIESVD